MRENALRIALVVSVVLNLFAIGAAGGAAVVWSHTRHAAVTAPRRRLFAAADTLPPADKARFWVAVREARRQTRDSRRTGRESRRLAAELFVRDTFDAAAVDGALAKARDADFALRASLEGAIVDFAKALPRSERVVLAQGLARGGPLRHPPDPSQLNEGAATAGRTFPSP